MRLLLPDIHFQVCALNRSELDTHAYPAEVIETVNQDNLGSYLQAAEQINKYADETILIVQHEYGIYGDHYGKYLIAFLKAVKCPVITTMHTVLENPPAEMHKVAKDIIALSDRLVTLTRNSYNLLLSNYPSAKSKIDFIEHGIHPTLFRKTERAKPRLKLTQHKILMTFGLLSRNKGIEYVIKALPAIVKQFPEALYLVVGGTHPDVLHQEGEAYRLELRDLVKKLGMQDHVRFIGDYLPLNKILLYLQATDVYIAPSLDPQQTVSGTLSYALGAGAAVVSTRFSQAQEVVNSNIGRIVPIGDSGAIGRAVAKLLGDPQALEMMRHSAYASTRSMLWPNIADNYIEKVAGLAVKSGRSLYRRPSINTAHLTEMTTNYGIIQFATRTRPNTKSGYTLDDNARAMQAVNTLALLQPELTPYCDQLSKTYLKTISSCLSYRPAVNYLSGASKKATRQNFKEDLNDSFGRAYYALQMVSSGPLKTAKKAKALIHKVPEVPVEAAPRSVAFYLLGACAALEKGDVQAGELVEQLADRLVKIYRQSSAADWKWFEPVMTYANGQLVASLLEAARLTGSHVYRQIGLEALRFLCQACFMGQVYAPIGQKGWYRREGPRTLFDQQPEDVFAAIQALESAYLLTRQKKYRQLASKAFSWFLGNNLMGLRLYDDKSGGCHDGLTPIGVNKNQGAESTLSYFQARLIVEQLGLS